MFATRYFAVRYFAGRYFPPSDIAVIIVSYVGAYAYISLYRPSKPLLEYDEQDSIVFAPVAHSDVEEYIRESVISPIRRNTDISGGIAASTIERVL